MTTDPERRSELEVGLAYGSDLERAHLLLGEAASSAEGVLESPPVEVFLSRFGESSIDFLIWYWHASDIESAYAATDHVVRAVDRICKENDLTISFPQRTLWWGESQVDLPSS
ncbi:MAG: hypothetical protein ACR2NL_08115 [Acidimicrobiia bacterium]